MRKARSHQPARGADVTKELKMGAAVGVVASVVLGGGAGGAMGGMMGGGLLGNIISGILGGGGASGGAGGIGKAMEGFAPANVLNATANLMNSILGNSGKEAVSTLHKEDGMPKFVRDAVHKAIDEAMDKCKKDVSPECQRRLDETTKDDSLAEIKKLTDQLLDKIRDIVGKNQNEATQDATSTGESDKGEGGKRGKVSAKSWFAAIAEAMGKVYGAKTQEVVKLSGEVSNVAKEQEKLAKESKNIKADDKDGAKQAEEAKNELAAKMTQKQTELQGAAQEMKLISETVSTLLKSVGEALAGMARKQ